MPSPARRMGAKPIRGATFLPVKVERGDLSCRAEWGGRLGQSPSSTDGREGGTGGRARTLGTSSTARFLEASIPTNVEIAEMPSLWERMVGGRVSALWEDTS